jgi:CO/xanthine dehydrogenase Mo-binding subunit
MAGATAREMLIVAAAKRLGVDPKSCKTKNGLVIAGAASYDMVKLPPTLPACLFPSSNLDNPVNGS